MEVVVGADGNLPAGVRNAHFRIHDPVAGRCSNPEGAASRWRPGALSSRCWAGVSRGSSARWCSAKSA